MPGFVDAHRHLWQSLSRNLGTTSDAVVARTTPPTIVYAATLVGLLQALEAGITTVVDWCDVFDDAAASRGRIVRPCGFRGTDGFRPVRSRRDAVR